ncbi:hypothetical protein CLAIMM_15052 isoform 2 [Cladophialophora immunda]|nr:hypothetical protein CLAIMM_15052 isoform 1 [Cladophialophora immunda]OQV11175.1 hypothetical protein CLAIMM_15052 isoform 2 [Cladophialophora immunda]
MSSVQCEDGFSDRDESSYRPRSCGLMRSQLYGRMKVESWDRDLFSPLSVPDADGEVEYEYWIDEFLNVHATRKFSLDVDPSIDNLPDATVSSDDTASVGEVDADDTGAPHDEELRIQSLHGTTMSHSNVEPLVDHAQKQEPVNSLLIITCVATCTLFALDPRQFLDTVLLLLLFAPFPRLARHLRYCLLIPIMSADLETKLEGAVAFGCLVFMGKD